MTYMSSGNYSGALEQFWSDSGPPWFHH